MKPAEPAPVYAVALFPGEGGEVREVRVLVMDLFGALSVAECIGAAVRSVNASGTPVGPWEFLPVQRLIGARCDGDGKRTVPARELAEKKTAYAARLAAGPAPAPLWPVRRKPRLPAGWLAGHEAQGEAA